jgi:hypothetical protein
MTEITQEQLNELKSQIQTDEALGAVLQRSLVVGRMPTASAVAADSSDSQSFNFDIKLLKISGSISKSGRLEFKGSVFGIQIGDTTADLSQHEVCYHPQLGKLVGVKYCFSFQNNCLQTRGEIDGWFEKRAHWNEKILCF